MRFVLLSGQIYCKWGEIKEKSQQIYQHSRKVLLNNTEVLLERVCIVHGEIENQNFLLSEDTEVEIKKWCQIYNPQWWIVLLQPLWG